MPTFAWETEGQESANEQNGVEKATSSMDLPEFMLILSLSADATTIDLTELLSAITRMLSYEMRQHITNFEDLVLDVTVKDQFSNRMLVERRRLVYNVLVILQGVAFFTSDSVPSTNDVESIIVQAFDGNGLVSYLQGSTNEALASASKSRVFLSSATEEESKEAETSSDIWIYALIVAAASSVALLAIGICICTWRKRRLTSWLELDSIKSDQYISKSSTNKSDVQSDHNVRIANRDIFVEPDVSPDVELNSSIPYENFSDYWKSKHDLTDTWKDQEDTFTDRWDSSSIASHDNFSLAEFGAND